MKFKASKFQKAIASFVKNGKGNGIVGAVAGSGKTTTLVNFVAPEIHGQGVFLAFNKAIATELGERLPSQFEAKTIHSLGFGALRWRYRRVKVDNRKVTDLIKDYLEQMPYASQKLIARVEAEEVEFFCPLVKLVDLVRATMTDTEDHDALENLCDHYQIDFPSDDESKKYLFDSLHRILSKDFELCSHVVDFGDMLYATARDKGLSPKKYDWILVDECQDLSKAQLAVIKKASKSGARFLFVGDERQAINGFAGADCDSFKNIKEEMNCTELPLSICYRCPSSHIELAQEIVPTIQAAPGAKKGTIENISRDKAVEELSEGDLFICRVNAPLVSMCFQLIADGKPARIKGRDIGKGLVAAAKKISKRKDFPGWEKFGEAVEAWNSREFKRLTKRNADEAKIEAVGDKAECLKIIWSRCNDGEGAQNLKSFEREVNSIFSDSTPGIQLSSVHRAKGLEADRVFIYQPELLPGPWAEPGSWQYEQEMNLKYVALTRSKDALFFVSK